MTSKQESELILAQEPWFGFVKPHSTPTLCHSVLNMSCLLTHLILNNLLPQWSRYYFVILQRSGGTEGLSRLINLTKWASGEDRVFRIWGPMSLIHKIQVTWNAVSYGTRRGWALKSEKIELEFLSLSFIICRPGLSEIVYVRSCGNPLEKLLPPVNQKRLTDYLDFWTRYLKHVSMFLGNRPLMCSNERKKNV